jgi:transcription antitermination factor NusG
LFVQSAPQFYFLKDVEGVTGIVLENGTAATSDRLDRVVEKMMRVERDNGLVEIDTRPPLKFKIGAQVRVIRGVLKDLLGVCSGITVDRRFAVFLDMLGRKVSVVYNGEDLAAA